MHLGGIHVGEAARNVVAAARKRPVTHVVDLELGIVGIDRGELEPELRNFLLQALDRGIRQHMGMDVDGSRHMFSRFAQTARRVVRISGGVMQYGPPTLCKTVFFSAAFGYKGRSEINSACGKHDGRHSGYENWWTTRRASSARR